MTEPSGMEEIRRLVDALASAAFHQVGEYDRFCTARASLLAAIERHEQDVFQRGFQAGLREGPGAYAPEIATENPAAIFAAMRAVRYAVELNTALALDVDQCTALVAFFDANRRYLCGEDEVAKLRAAAIERREAPQSGDDKSVAYKAAWQAGSDCDICGKPESLHSGMERFCPIYATYRSRAARSSSGSSTAARTPEGEILESVWQALGLHGTCEDSWHPKEKMLAAIAWRAPSPSVAPAEQDKFEERTQELIEILHYRAQQIHGLRNTPAGQPMRDDLAMIESALRHVASELFLLDVDRSPAPTGEPDKRAWLR